MYSCFFRLPASFLHSLHIRLNFRRDLCFDHAVIEGRVMVNTIGHMAVYDPECLPPEISSLMLTKTVRRRKPGLWSRS